MGRRAAANLERQYRDFLGFIGVVVLIDPVQITATGIDLTGALGVMFASLL